MIGSKKGTNIKVLNLNYSHIEQKVTQSAGFNATAVVLPVIIVIVLVIGITIFLLI